MGCFQKDVEGSNYIISPVNWSIYRVKCIYNTFDALSFMDFY